MIWISLAGSQYCSDKPENLMKLGGVGSVGRWKREGGEWEVWGERGESLAPLSSPSSPPTPSSEGRSALSLSQQTTFLTEQYWAGSYRNREM